MTSYDKLYYWAFASAIIIAIGGFVLIRSRQQSKLRKKMLDDSLRELDFQKLALDEHVIVSIADVKGNITYVNDKFCEISGYPREELLGENHRVVKSNEHSEEFYRELWRSIANGKPWHGEIKNKKKDGGHYWVLSTIVPFLDQLGKPSKYVGIRTDITARKDAEKEKHEAAAQEIQQFKATLDFSHDPIHMFWPDTLKFFYGNQAALDQVGCTEKELFSMTPMDINPNRDEAKFRERLETLIHGAQKSFTYETLHPDSTGEMIAVEIELQYIEPTGAKARFVTIIRDITERKALEKSKSEFISTVSHELRTPLTSIKGALGLINTGALGELPEKVQPMLNIAYKNSERLVSLINDILDIEKLEARKMRFQMHSADMSALLEEAVAANAGYGEEYGVSFTCSGTEEPLFVNADPDRLMQVMANLLSNAAKFSPRDGQVEISLARHDGSLHVAVKDSGSGIPEAAQETIFEKFTQADASDQKQQGGTGLGLSIAKMIVEEHDGHIGFTTEVGKGTTFYFDLPELEVEDGLSTVVLPAGEDAPHLLIVEDDPDVAHLLEYMLQNAGYRTSVAGTARQAKELLAAETFDGMTLDITLPGQNGISLLKELREQPATEDLPVVIVSAYVDKGKKELNGDAVNTVEWIQKPIDPQCLISRLGRVLGRFPDIATQILHVEDDEDICEIVSTIVADEANIIIARSLKDAMTLLAQQKFDLVILDLELPDGNGEGLLPLLRIPPQSSPSVVIFSANEETGELAEFVQAVLVKSQATNQEILETIQSVIETKRTAKSETDGKVL